MKIVKANDATATHRRAYFDLRDATDGITIELGENGGQPQVSTDGEAWTNTGIGVLVSIGNGRYYAGLTQTLIATAGTVIETRYKSANTAESPGDSFQIVAFDPNDAASLGLTNLDATVASRSTFKPSTDVVAKVTLVQKTTENSDMRGTNGANTVVPDNTGIGAIKTTTDKFVFTNENQVDANAVSGGGGGGGDATAAKQDQILADIAAIDTPGGSGGISWTIEVKDNLGAPIAGVAVWATTDVGGTNVIAGELVTDTFGKVVFDLDAGSYYLWRQLAGYDFTNPQTMVVS